MIFVVLFFRTKITTVEIKNQPSHIIFVDKNIFIDVDGLTKKEVIQTIINESLNTTVKDGGIEAIYLLENKNEQPFTQSP